MKEQELKVEEKYSIPSFNTFDPTLLGFLLMMFGYGNTELDLRDCFPEEVLDNLQKKIKEYVDKQLSTEEIENNGCN